MKFPISPAKHPLTIRNKMLLSFFTLIFIPMCVLVVIAYINVTNAIVANTRYSAELSFNQAIAMLSDKVDAMIKASDIVYSNSDVRNILARERNDTDIVQQNKDMLFLASLLNSLHDTDNVYSVSLYVPEWMMFSDQNIIFHDFDQFKKTAEYYNLLQCKDTVLWELPENISNLNGTDNQVEVLSFLRRIYDPDDYSSVIGVVKVSILQENVDEILNRANISKGGSVFIQNENGEIICATGTSQAMDIARSNKIEGISIDWQKVEYLKKSYLINSAAVENTDWNLTTSIPYDEFYAVGNHINHILLILAFVLGFVAFGISYLISTSITRRIILLRQNMLRVQQGDLDIAVSTNGQDELDKCIESFNFMLKQIKALLQEQYEDGQKIRRTELEVLQAQINPHFLYNILELINWKALDYNASEISEISLGLAKFYRTGLSKGESVVPFTTEIEHIQAYVEIQNIRFHNSIELEFAISEEVYQYYILKMILQPLVENAIVHGILESGRGSGHIWIRADKAEEDLIITVEDNGAGITEEKLAALSANEDLIGSRGYGVKNIAERIKLCYGPSYGLSYQSDLGCGTCVTVTVPAWYAWNFPQ